MYSDRDSLNLILDRDDIYVYELPPEQIEVFTVCVYFREETYVLPALAGVYYRKDILCVQECRSENYVLASKHVCYMEVLIFSTVEKCTVGAKEVSVRSLKYGIGDALVHY